MHTYLSLSEGFRLNLAPKLIFLCYTQYTATATAINIFS